MVCTEDCESDAQCVDVGHAWGHPGLGSRVLGPQMFEKGGAGGM